MAGFVCIDASLALMLILPDQLSVRAEELRRQWHIDGIDLVTPPLFYAEVTSVLRESVYFGRIDADEGEAAFAISLLLGIRGVDPPSLQQRAWSLARLHNRPRAYDAQYLAVASIMNCDLWTGDKRLVNAVRAPWVRWVGD